ncbi:hypothetical protein KFL_009680010 [Klebsormidium nitens]|uniref:Transmembrane adaptor Erv26 n=1 Tax=Klebsormidium nitens TaxID=105231 RepID=A0A1Y1IS00_KLENI|nr:hypothetical protein KFL_009680010 [Klebsormidium nitens]|eukprot:GAQ92289.1 hypothetical protein KFL_009680010 [Klebsormidium nitens]
MFPLSTLIVYVGGYLFLVFFAVCLATGLYYIAELVEEYTRLTKRVIGTAIKVVIGIHVALLLWDRLPVLPIAVGIGSHVVYYRLLKTFPYISLTSPDFLGSVGLVVLSHIVWFRFFAYDYQRPYLTLEYVIGFFLIMVWLIPFAYFISLAANESVLPGAGGPGASYGGYTRQESDPTYMGGGKRSRGTLLGIFNFLKRKRDDMLPQFTSKIPSSYLSSKERVL